MQSFEEYREAFLEKKAHAVIRGAVTQCPFVRTSATTTVRQFMASLVAFGGENNQRIRDSLQEYILNKRREESGCELKRQLERKAAIDRLAKRIFIMHPEDGPRWAYECATNFVKYQEETVDEGKE